MQQDPVVQALAEQIAGMHHVGIAARDLPSAYAVYRDLLGFQVQRELQFPAQQVQIALLRKEAEWLEILVPTDPASAVGRFLEKRGPGLHHVCFAVRDLEGARDRLRTLDVQPVHDHAVEGVWGPVLFIHPKAAHGVMIELLELRPSQEA